MLNMEMNDFRFINSIEQEDLIYIEKNKFNLNTNHKKKTYLFN